MRTKYLLFDWPPRIVLSVILATYQVPTTCWVLDLVAEVIKELTLNVHPYDSSPFTIANIEDLNVCYDYFACCQTLKTDVIHLIVEPTDILVSSIIFEHTKHTTVESLPHH